MKIEMQLKFYMLVMILKYTRLNITFYLSSFLAFILWFMTPKYTMAVYTPNLLGWISIILIPIALITFLWLSILDLNKNRKKGLLKRVLYFIVIIGISVGYWMYRAKSLGNI